MGYDPINNLYNSPAPAVDPQRLKEERRAAEQEQRILRSAAQAEKTRLKRLRDGLQIKTKAKQQLQTPQPIRQLSRLLQIGDYGKSEWQLHNQAAGYPYAPPQQPVDWDRMNYRDRQWNRSFWR